MKRMIDIIFSLVLCLMTAPFLLWITLLIWLKMGRPILFKQQRAGQHGQSFFVYKFRTMNDKVDEHGVLLPDELRLTAVGSFLRKYSLDELPQLFNVLKGEMSLVGPRPLLLEYIPLYTKEQNKRHQVKPGITGWAQVNGRNAVNWEERLKMDCWYVENQSLYIDVKILLLTCLKVIKKEGISHPNHVTMEKFTGTKEGI